MKNLTAAVKKVLSALLTAALLTALAPTLAAAETDSAVSSPDSADAAGRLHELGLFRGVGTNADGTPDFELWRNATRNEAVTVLVRLLGKEKAANSAMWDIPFTDVPLWASRYVGYAYYYDLTGGTSPTTFSGDAEVTAEQFVTFVLRALGYSSGIHFSWDDPWELSDSIGLTSGASDYESFTRGDIAIISLNALSVKLKESELTLSDKLIDDGVFTRKAYTEVMQIETLPSDIPVWDGSTYSFKGQGTESSPYLIESPANLAALAKSVNYGSTYSGKHFLLTTDIDLDMREWTPIGNYSRHFEGSFDGGGHTIHNLYISTFDRSGVSEWNEWHNYLSSTGLFGYLDGGEIKDLTVNGIIEIEVPDWLNQNSAGVGAIAGIAVGDIINCHNACDISLKNYSANGYVTAGGIAGYYYGGLVEGCTNTGDISGYGLHSVRVGGIGGDNPGVGTMKDCVNYGTVRADGKSDDLIAVAGGMTAKTYNGSILNCQNRGDVSAVNRAGGIVGYQNGSETDAAPLIEGCLNLGKVTASQCGGITAAVYIGTVRECQWDKDNAFYAIGHLASGAVMENVSPYVGE